MSTPPDVVYALAMDRASGLGYAARLSGLVYTPDGGQHWQDAYSALERDDPLPTTALALSPDFSRDKTLFAGVTGAVLRSTDAGAGWHIASLGTPPPAISALVVSPDYAHDGVVYAGALEDGVFRSADRGLHWRAANFGLLDWHVLCMVISPDFAQDETLFAGTESGVFISENGGLSWRETDFPMERAPVISLCLSQQDHALLAGTESHGLFRSPDRGKTWARIDQDILRDPVNAVHWRTENDLLVLHGDTLMVSADRGSTWTAAANNFAQPITAIAPVLESAEWLVGFENGDIQRVEGDVAPA